MTLPPASESGLAILSPGPPPKRTNWPHFRGFSITTGLRRIRVEAGSPPKWPVFSQGRFRSPVSETQNRAVPQHEETEQIRRTLRKRWFLQIKERRNSRAPLHVPCCSRSLLASSLRRDSVFSLCERS